jgi:hypothetical protein
MDVVAVSVDAMLAESGIATLGSGATSGQLVPLPIGPPSPPPHAPAKTKKARIPGALPFLPPAAITTPSFKTFALQASSRG